MAELRTDSKTENKKEKKSNSGAKERVAQVLHQAKESLKILETLEKETLARARNFVKFPSASDRQKMTNAKILASLKKLGVATQGDLEGLQARVHQLEAELHHLRFSKLNSDQPN